MGKNTKTNGKNSEASEINLKFEQQNHDQEIDSFNESESIDNIEEENEAHLLNAIRERVIEEQDQLKLTWAAIHHQRTKEKEFNRQMNEEIDAIKDKYQMLKAPIHREIANAAFGKCQNQKIYKEYPECAKIDLSKVKPQPIEDFWLVILGSCGLLNQKQDADVISKCTSIEFQIIDLHFQHLKCKCTFQDNNYFHDKSLTCEVRMKEEFARKTTQEPIKKYKGEKHQDSLFTKLFDKETEADVTIKTMIALYNAYAMAPYFYFNEKDGESEEGLDEDDLPSDQNVEDSEEDSEEIEDGKGRKKVKPNEIEKPECKQQ